jgi:proton-dependent oligopeptide transporter, POT family
MFVYFIQYKIVVRTSQVIPMSKEKKISKEKQGFPATFYVANGMEIFERLAWYGFFAVSSVYMTTPVAQGGGGFSESERGAVQGIIPFFLYLLPVVTGALGDRYGYRRMFLLSFAIMAPGYYLLGQTDSFMGFFMALSAVALGAACFKPVVVGTVGRCTDSRNRGLGFGIFYTMVNVGGFIGPLVAGYMRSISWDAVFIMSALWILLNFIPALFFYREPTERATRHQSLSQVLAQAQQVLGNGRFALMLFPCILLLMAAGVSWLSYSQAFLYIGAWLVVNLVWNRGCRPGARHWLAQPVRVSNLPFALYLLILTGFWTVYNQLFYTLPLYIRDYVDTADLLAFLSIFGDWTVNFFAHVDIAQLTSAILKLVPLSLGPEAMRLELVHLKVNVPEHEIMLAIEQLRASADQQKLASEIARRWLDYRQVNPEYLINLDFAAIIIMQILVSYVCQFFRTFYVLITGILVMGAGIFLAVFVGPSQTSGSLMVLLILCIAMGEMLTAPKSQEYVASLAPEGQTALYMGYYFVSMALGFLFAGFLSGWGYGYLVRTLHRPDLMWGLFALISLLTACALLWFDLHYRRPARVDENESSQAIEI